MDKAENKNEEIEIGACFMTGRPTNELRVVKKTVMSPTMRPMEVVVGIQRLWIASNGFGTTLEKWEDLPSAGAE